MKNSADLGGCYSPRPSALVDNTLLDLKNPSYPTQPHSIIAKYFNTIMVYQSITTLLRFSSRYQRTTSDGIERGEHSTVLPWHVEYRKSSSKFVNEVISSLVFARAPFFADSPYYVHRKHLQKHLPNFREDEKHFYIIFECSPFAN